ncbi:hypothetical protein N2603_38990 [Bradyrhizobium huanghuaihaiense]|uniref:hypothetical protein n=1 Tax=Bradyrhizobium huanghuaihaiense TaxID=990078 RepID=UPI0021AAEA4C|nr:hypothetical protein [Bradyrhizobium sp. CB3035]UWU75873.1 hypothetical protein N2603_38990 [Bradyrhizobium sp. CB3035]
MNDKFDVYAFDSEPEGSFALNPSAAWRVVRNSGISGYAHQPATVDSHKNRGFG